MSAPDSSPPPAPSPTTPPACLPCGLLRRFGTSEADVAADHARNHPPSAPPAPAPASEWDTMEQLAHALVAARVQRKAFPESERAASREQDAEWRWSQATTPERVAQLVAAARLLPEFIHEDDDCQYDHHGYCQAHNLHERPCPHERAKALLAASPAQEATPPREQSCDCDECLASRGKLRDDAGPAQEAPPYTTTSIDLPVESVNGQLVATPPREWSGIWNNWIAPFHACPRCGASLNWKQGEDALERPLITASHCGVYFSAPMAWRAE